MVRFLRAVFNRACQRKLGMNVMLCGFSDFDSTGFTLAAVEISQVWEREAQIRGEKVGAAAFNQTKHINPAEW